MNLIIGVLIICIIYLLYKKYDKKRVCNDVDGRCYKVSKKFDNKVDASVLLANINIYCINVLRHLRNKFIWGTPTEYTLKWRDNVQFLLNNYTPDGIIENVPIGIVNTSYVEGKGKIFAICLREKVSGNNNFQDMHDLQFVVLHELAHLCTYGYGHEMDFWVNFKFLLIEANEAGLHKPIDYAKYPINYCNLVVNYNPYFDEIIKL
jgi:hypothetical protein